MPILLPPCNENEAHFVLVSHVLYNSISERHFPFLFQNVVLESLKSLFQSDYQVDIDHYLMEATATCCPFAF